jgi:murein DD-endopeptidase MepM/ murein hydrolase activator NlpD
MLTYTVVAAAAFALVVAGLTFAPEASAATAAELAKQVEALNDEVKAAGAEYDSAYWELHETEVRLEGLNNEVIQTQAQLELAEAAFADRAYAMYTRSEDDVLSFILGSTSFAEFATRVELFERLTSADAQAIADVKALRASYEAQVAEVEREVAQQERDVAALQDKKEALEGQLASKKREYERLQAQLAAAMAREAAAGRRTYTPPKGPNGMVFPVAGANYYSDTWGASRSGGRRRHKGTDIMASRGTPVVATLSGTVRAKTGGLGGKTIWLTADNGWSFYYAHLDSYTVSSGRVSAGQQIGTVGSTGNASGGAPHLHFEIHPGGGAAVNPYPYLRQMQ